MPPPWTVHWMEAGYDLSPWRDAISNDVEIAYNACAQLVTIKPLDILIRKADYYVIPQLGTGGVCIDEHTMLIVLQPDNPNFEKTIASGDIQRTISHELHHCLRTGMGMMEDTLASHLVSEGLAGQFTRLVYGNPPEPWECAVDRDTLRSLAPTKEELESDDDIMNRWFFPREGKIPFLFGYTLGYEIVGNWLESIPKPDEETLIGVDTDVVLDTGFWDVFRAASNR